MVLRHDGELEGMIQVLGAFKDIKRAIALGILSID